MNNRVLLVKARLELESLTWLDRICNGLLSWSFHRGLLKSETSAAASWLMLIPEYATFQRVYLWPEKTSPDWKAFSRDSREWIVQWTGAFSKEEISEARKLFADLSEWKASGGAAEVGA